MDDSGDGGEGQVGTNGFQHAFAAIADGEAHDVSVGETRTDAFGCSLARLGGGEAGLEGVEGEEYIHS